MIQPQKHLKPLKHLDLLFQVLSMIQQTHTVAQNQHRRQSNTEVCRSKSALSFFVQPWIYIDIVRCIIAYQDYDVVRVF